LNLRASNQNNSSASGRPRGPQGLGEQAASALEQDLGASQGIGAVEEEAFLKHWFQSNGLLISDSLWEAGTPITSHTAEHEVRYRGSDHRAVKRTWPGTFGFVPTCIDGSWQPAPASPSQYLHRQALQNELFGDQIVLEGAMVSSGPSMLIGQPPGGLSLVISQPWLDAVDVTNPHPDQSEIATLMQERGFEPLFASLYGWKSNSNGWVVLDAKPDNFIITPDGILPIDLLLTEITTD
jgi:hypothetical protein